MGVVGVVVGAGVPVVDEVRRCHHARSSVPADGLPLVTLSGSKPLSFTISLTSEVID